MASRQTLNSGHLSDTVGTSPAHLHICKNILIYTLIYYYTYYTRVTYGTTAAVIFCRGHGGGGASINLNSFPLSLRTHILILNR